MRTRRSNSPTTGTPRVYAGGRNFGHLAYAVDDIYATCDRLMKHGVTINRPPRDGRMAFVRSPDKISVELLQKGEARPPAEPWKSMPQHRRVVKRERPHVDDSGHGRRTLGH